MATPDKVISEAMKIAAEDEIKTKQREVKYDIRDFTVDYLVKQFKDDLFYVPNYQRKFIWKTQNQCRFIESILLGLPIPMMFVADMDDGRLEIVDGAQRIQTLEAFLSDDLVLQGLEHLPALNCFKFSTLPEGQRRKFGNKAMRIVVLDEPTSIQTRQEIFNRINTSGIRAKPSEIRSGAYAGPFMSFLTKCADNSLFKRLCPMSPSLKQRREGEELILRLFAYTDRYLGFKHDVDTFLDDYAEDKQKLFDEKAMMVEFTRVMEFVDRYFPNGFAKKKGAKIDRSKHCVLETGHPSPLSANRGLWFGNQHFSKTNDYLKSLGKDPIIW